MTTTAIGPNWIKDFERELGPWFRDDLAEDVLVDVEVFDPDFFEELVRFRTVRGATQDVRNYLKRRPRS